jgi:acetyltransferase-like isoleucine patch superfamily enzyme/dTDP-4-dehydrorhamnose 3,5-epimerase-like enzyme
LEEIAGVFIHPDARCESRKVGRGTRVWAFAHVLPEAEIGEDCNVCDHTFLENDVVVGDRVTIKCGVQLWDGLRIEDDVFVGPNATFMNDPFPRSRAHLGEHPKTLVRRGASIGANATVLPGIEVGRNAMVAAGAVVTHSVPPNAIVAGNPARIHGYVDTKPAVEADRGLGGATTFGDPDESRVEGVVFHSLPEFEDLRGRLVAADFPAELPFEPKRMFVVFDVPSKDVRGEHSHRECDQLLVCVRGSLRVMADDGSQRQEFSLDSPRRALRIPPMVWAAQYRFSSDAVLVVLASDPYEAGDYLRDYDEWLALVGHSGSR